MTIQEFIAREAASTVYAVILWTKKRKDGNEEPRAIGMSAQLRTILERRWKKRGNQTLVFTNPNTGQAYTRNTPFVKYLFSRLCERAREQRPEIEDFTAHEVRHYVSDMLNKKQVNLRRVQKFLGHQRLSTTENYIHDLEADQGIASLLDEENLNAPPECLSTSDGQS